MKYVIVLTVAVLVAMWFVHARKPVVVEEEPFVDFEKPATTVSYAGCARRST